MENAPHIACRHESDSRACNMRNMCEFGGGRVDEPWPPCVAAKGVARPGPYRHEQCMREEVYNMSPRACAAAAARACHHHVAIISHKHKYRRLYPISANVACISSFLLRTFYREIRV